MDKDLSSFEVKLPYDVLIKFQQNENIYDFLKQFQEHCPNIICIVDNSFIQYYNRNGPFLDSLTEVSIDMDKDIHVFKDSEHTYTILNSECAKLFSKKESKELLEIQESPKVLDILTSIAPTAIVSDFKIIHNGRTYIFPYYDISDITSDININSKK